MLVSSWGRYVLNLFKKSDDKLTLDGKRSFLFLCLGILAICMIALFGCKSQTTNETIAKTNLPPEKDSNSLNVEFSGEHVTADVPQTVQKGNDLTLSLDIEYFRDPNTTWKNIPDPQKTPSLYPEGELTVPITEYEVLMDNIHVYIGGKEYNDSYTWMYQRNNINTLKIKKEYVVNDIKIQVVGTPRTATLTLYGIEFDDDFAAQIKNGTVKATFKTAYQNYGTVPIRTFSNGELNCVFEDDDIDVTFTTTDPNGLPKNLWFRNCSRNTTLGEDFFREYSDNGKTCHIYVPHYLVRDHSSIRNLED